VIDVPPNHDILAVIRFLRAKHMNDFEIHDEPCTVYDENVMTEGHKAGI
jgi:hypothetical protein